MAFLSFVRELRQFPRALAAVTALAILVALLATYRVSGLGLESRRYEVGYARAAALIDTSPSQAVDAPQGGGGIGELTNRAVLVADLMTRDPLRNEIADRAGIARSTLLTQRPMNGLERRLTLHEVSRATVTTNDRDASLLRVAVNPLLEGENPIIGVDVRGPTPAAAAKLADASLAVAQDYLQREAAETRPLHELTVHQLEPATADSATVGPSHAIAVLGALVVFLLGCAVIIGASRLAGALRARRRLAF